MNMLINKNFVAVEDSELQNIDKMNKKRSMFCLDEITKSKAYLVPGHDTNLLESMTRDVRSHKIPTQRLILYLSREEALLWHINNIDRESCLQYL